MLFSRTFVPATVLLRATCCVVILALSACKPATEVEKAAERTAKTHAAPVKGLSQGKALQKSVAELQDGGFQCENFTNAMNRPVMRCTRIKGEGVKACADSVWLEYDAQQNVTSVAPYNECN